MDEVAQVQGVQNTQPESEQQHLQTPLTESPREHGYLRKIFNASSWFVFFAFLPVTVLILLSQNTIPGDLFYPVKRSMENVVLAAATVSPATRVAFRTDLTERRFTEAETLLLARKDTIGFTNFIEEVVATEQEISALSNQDAKKDVTEKLIRKIEEYQNKLIAIEAKIDEETPTLITSKKDPSSVSTSVEKPSTVTAPQTSPLTTRTQGASAPIPTPTPTYIEQSDIITSKLTPTAVILEPTLEPTATATETLSYNTPEMPTIPSDTEESEEKDEKDEIAKAIDDTQKQLDEIKKQLEEENHKDLNEEGDEDKPSEARTEKDNPGKEKHDDQKDREENTEKEKR